MYSHGTTVNQKIADQTLAALQFRFVHFNVRKHTTSQVLQNIVEVLPAIQKCVCHGIGLENQLPIKIQRSCRWLRRQKYTQTHQNKKQRTTTNLQLRPELFFAPVFFWRSRQVRLHYFFVLGNANPGKQCHVKVN